MNEYAVVFDMDGVIVHTNPYHDIAFAQFFDKHGVVHSPKAFEEHMYGKHNGYIIRHFFQNPEMNEADVKILADEKEALFREIYKDFAVPITGFNEFLNELKSNGFKTGVATSAPRENLELIMGILKFETQMESILSSDDVTLHKPDPQVYLKSMQSLGVNPENTVVFEDSFSGIMAGKNAGAKVVGVLTTHSKEQLPPCDFYIQDYNDINVEIIKNILGI